MRWGSLLRFVLLILALAPVVARIFWVDVYQIPQNGMYPGSPAGSRVFALRTAYRYSVDVKRGDVAIYKENRAAGTVTFIWRVIGLPGDRIDISGEQVSVNGMPLEHKRLRTEGNLIVYQETSDKARYEVAYDRTVPDRGRKRVSLIVDPETFFLLGDNRDDARDCRFTGPVPFSEFVGRKL